MEPNGPMEGPFGSICTQNLLVKNWCNTSCKVREKKENINTIYILLFFSIYIYIFNLKTQGDTFIKQRIEKRKWQKLKAEGGLETLYVQKLLQEMEK